MRTKSLSFVYQVYQMYDRHVPVERFLPLLAPTNLWKCAFGNDPWAQAPDFKRWYGGMGKTSPVTRVP